MHFGLIFSGVLMLVVSSYLDNVRGPLLPVLARDLGLPYAQTSFLLVWGNLVAVVLNLSLLSMVARFGVHRVGLLLCFVPPAIAGAGYLVTGAFSLSLFAALLGGALAFMGVTCNLLVIEGTTLESRSRYFCVLHMMYGFGSFLGPVGVRWILNRGDSWQSVFWLIVPVSLLVAGLLAGLKGVGHVRVPRNQRVRHLPTAGHWLVIVTFSIYVMCEVLTSMWMVPFLVESKGMTVVEAAPYLSGFFLIMGITRALGFIPLRPAREKYVLLAVVLGAGLFSVLAQFGFLWALPLVGVIGPFFPLLLARATRHFSTVATHLTVWVLTGIQLTLAFSHLTVGRLTDRLGLATVYWLPTLCVFLTFALALVYFWRIERR